MILTAKSEYVVQLDAIDSDILTVLATDEPLTVLVLNRLLVVFLSPRALRWLLRAGVFLNFLGVCKERNTIKTELMLKKTQLGGCLQM